MADEPDTSTNEETEAAARSGPGLIVWLLLGSLAIAGGFAAPFLLPMAKSADASRQAVSSDDDDQKLDGDIAFVPFGEVTVNLDEGRLNRYLRVSITLQIEKADETSISEQLERRKAVLRNWLLSHLADKAMDDIRGASGQNRLRREIRDHFNTTLFADGYDRIHDVLFEEFNVQ